MSNIKLIIEERASNIGNFIVGRLLPFREKRMVGPFSFIDHMGPISLSDHENLDVPPHPHIGLSTLTYLFKGSIMHKDSLGNEVEIKPGQVNWMTAGSGIVHSERTPEYLRHSCEFEMHENTTVYIFGGEPFPEERFIYWNLWPQAEKLLRRQKPNGLSSHIHEFLARRILFRFHHRENRLNN